MHPVIIKLLSALISLVTFVLLSVIILALHNWYQSGDTYSFVFWTIPLATGLALSGGSIIPLIKTPNVALKVFFIFIIACLVSLVWFYAMFAFWGVMENPLSFQPFYLWIAGSFVQLLFLDMRLPRPAVIIISWTVVLGIFAFPVLLFVLMYLMIFMYSLISKIRFG